MPPSPPPIVFDFDGVIADSEPMHEAALRAAARALGMDFSHDAYVSRYLGFDDRDTWRAIAADNQRTLTAADTARLNDLKFAAVQAAFARGEPAPVPGSLDLVRAAARAGLVAICSGARRQEILPILARFEIADLFPIITTADDVPIAKPDPAGYTLTARRLGAIADRTQGSAPIAIEDTPKGAAAARAAGYRVVAIRHSLKHDPFTDADLILDSFAGCPLNRILSA